MPVFALANAGVERLHRLLVLDQLPRLCESIDSITPTSDRAGNLYCLWGAFEVSREELRGGVRFSLLNCPHALAWTITCDASAQRLLVHCTIDKTEVDPDFAESIQHFVDDWATGLERALRAPLPAMS
ncbi:MAG: hypothetical protein P8Y78_04275 [Acidihalobacter sp.]